MKGPGPLFAPCICGSKRVVIEEGAAAKCEACGRIAELLLPYTLSVRPGDCVILSHPGILSIKGAERLEAQLKGHLFGANPGKVLVLEEGARIQGVLRPQTGQQAETRED